MNDQSATAERSGRRDLTNYVIGNRDDKHIFRSPIKGPKRLEANANIDWLSEANTLLPNSPKHQEAVKAILGRRPRYGFNGHLDFDGASIRRECLNHMIVINEWHLPRIQRSYFSYYIGGRICRWIRMLRNPDPFRISRRAGSLKSGKSADCIIDTNAWPHSWRCGDSNRLQTFSM